MIAVLVVVTATGLADADVRALQEHLEGEVRAQGAEAVRSGIDATCVDDPACVKGALELANARALVALDATRAGSFVQLSVRSIALDGAVLAQADRSTKLDALKRERLLPDGALPAPEPPSAPEATPEEVPVHEEAPLVREELAPESDDVEPQPAMSPRALAGIAVIGAGVVVVGIGAAAAAVELSVIKDPGSLGEDKERAAVLVPVMGAVALAGLAAVVTGAVIVALE
jgi:hypothetical protein